VSGEVVETEPEEDGRWHVSVETEVGAISGQAIDLRDRACEPSRSALQAQLDRTASWRDRPEFDDDLQFSTITGEPPELQRLLAVAARSRGITTPHDRRIETLATASDGPDEEITASDLRDARRRVAETGAKADRLRERVAMRRGQLQAEEETDGDVEPIRESLETAMRDLTEAETDKLAAEQTLEYVRRQVRGVRDGRERRLRRHDALRNRTRDARQYLARTVYDEFVSAAERLPGESTPGRTPEAFSGNRVTAHLAAVTLAETAEPVLLASGSHDVLDAFDSPRQLATQLGTPVVLSDA
jgi:hypothetical protein